jgi:hypothetical protein
MTAPDTEHTAERTLELLDAGPPIPIVCQSDTRFPGTAIAADSGPIGRDHKLRDDIAG